ncbi:unnamed protein product [Parajaminaea phylloscopi]
MHIKTLTIQGFKSYRDQVAIEPFSPGHNVIVGRNGSGKSNFFSAIRFVLSDAYSSMSREERQALLHDSSSSTTTTLSAFVEIIFDNADGRFPTNGSEVVLRRTIGLKKDEYSIDRRSASKADVSNLLEAAGFSRSNPYYIVPQGRITHLTNIKDSERLNLLKEVAGTRVYEQRRAESLKIMNETDAKRLKIEDLLKYIEERLSELDEEKEELKNYYEKDRERRCLEYAIYQRELNDIARLLEELDEHRLADTDASSARRVEFQDRERELARLEQVLSERKQMQAQMQLEKDTLVGDGRELARTLAQLEAEIKDDEESTERNEELRTSLQHRLEEVEDEIATKEEELVDLVPECESFTRRVDQDRNRLEQIKARLALLIAKGGRSAQFRTQEERNIALQKQVDELRSFQAAQTERQQKVQQARAEMQTKLDELSETIKARTSQIEQRKRSKEDSIGSWTKTKTEREELIERRKELLKEETKLASSTTYAREQLNNAQRTLASTMDRATSQGLQSVERIVRDHDIQGVYGPLYQLFSVDDKYQTAAEVTANASLFHIVVDTDATAGKVLEVMNRERAGRVTFMPLNRLNPKDQDYPSGSEAIPLINKLRFDQQFAPAMRQVFGKMIVCPDLEIAGAYVRSHGLNAITLEGDKVEKRGALTGGYHDPRKSRLDAVRDVKRWRESFDSDQARLEEVKKTTLDFDQTITALTSQMQTLETAVSQASTSRGPLLEELQYLRSEESDLRAQIATASREADAIQLEIDTATIEREALEGEIASPMQQGLSDAEQAERDALYAEEEEIRSRLGDLSRQAAEMTSRKASLQIDVEESLKRERDSISARLEDIGEDLAGPVSAKGGDLGHRRGELERLRAQRQERRRRVDEIEAELEKLAQEMQTTQEQHDQTYSAQVETARQIDKQQKSVDRYMSKRQRFLEQKDKCNAHVRDLGVLPEEAYEKYTSEKHTMDRLVKRLHKVNDALKEYSSVNKKAVEQYNNFTKQRDQLTQRHAELDKSAESIQELIDVLDLRKDEAIERTFKQVSKNFEQVFAKLVPAGRGRLIMQRRIDQEANGDGNSSEGAEDDEDERPGRKSTIDNYTGVSIKVSFNSKVDEGLRIQQLSGGQKSLVALATVFAIQKCDPAPFYLFDEIDANLDAQYRTAVAAMIHELSDTAQFITTTFRPELIAVCERHYGVLFDANKISSIRTISRDEANAFVEAAADAGGR